MAFSSLALRGSMVAHATMWEMIAPERCAPAIIEIGVINETATGCEFGLGRPSIPCVGPTLNSFQMDNLNEPQTKIKAAVSYRLSGGIPYVFRRRAQLVGGQGCSVILTYPRGLIVPASTSMCLWITATLVAITTIPLTVHCVIED